MDYNKCSWILLTGKNKGNQCQEFVGRLSKYCKNHREKGAKLDEEKDREEERRFVMEHGITRAQHAAEQQKIAEAAARAKAEAEEKEFVEKHGMGSVEYNRKLFEEAELARKLAEEKRMEEIKAKYSDEEYCIKEFTQCALMACDGNMYYDDFDGSLSFDEKTGIITSFGKRYILKVCKLD